VKNPEPSDPVLKGIMAEISAQELVEDDITVSFLEFPVQSDPSSDKRKKFWSDLEKACVLDR